MKGMGKELGGSEEAISSVVGMMIIIVTTIATIGLILFYSMPALLELEGMAETQKMEQSFTLFDSRTSKTALGESPIQMTQMSIMGGTININGDANAYSTSNIRIQAFNSTGLVSDFSSPMGSVEYRKDGKVIAYEGGGVWSKYPTGKPVMLSPPEFHYNGETLTLPIMKVNGRSSISGSDDVNIIVNSDNMPFVLYPNPKLDSSRVNPMSCEKIHVYIESEFYEAWVDYINKLTHASAKAYDSNNTAFIKLDVVPPMRTSILTSFIRMGTVNQTNPEPIEDFNFDLQARDPSGLKNLNCDIEASSGNKTLTYHLQKKNSPNSIYIELTYEDTGAGNNYTEHWVGEDLFPVNGTDEDAYSMVDFLNTTFTMEYNPPNLDGADPDFSWGPNSSISALPDVVINDEDKLPLYNLTQHYMALMARDEPITFNLNWPGGSNPVDFSDSTYTLVYDNRESVTYLHVTRNELYTTLGN